MFSRQGDGNMTPMKEVARLAHVQEGHKAWAFCARVKSLFTKDREPSDQEIIECLKGLNTRTTPDQVAQMIRTARGAQSGFLGAAKSEKFSRKNPNRRALSGARRPIPQRKPSQKTTSVSSSGLEEINTPSPVMRHDPRKFTEPFAKCPHGVPITGVCHICKGGTLD